jgi:hypothetical protein
MDENNPIKEKIKRVVIEPTEDGRLVRMAFLDAQGKTIYEEFYHTFDTAVAMVQVMWERFRDETKPDR